MTRREGIAKLRHCTCDDTYFCDCFLQAGNHALGPLSQTPDFDYKLQLRTGGDSWRKVTIATMCFFRWTGSWNQVSSCKSRCGTLCTTEPTISLEKTKIFKCLGSLLTNQNSIQEEIKCRLKAGRINLPLFSTVVPAVTLVFLSCRPFVAITTLSTGFVVVEVTSVSWLEQLTVGV